MSAEIGDWTDSKSFSPRLQLTTDAPMADTLEVLAGALDDAGWKIKEQETDGFRARYADWFALAAGDAAWTTIAVSGRETAAGTEVVVDVERGGIHKKARKGGPKALSAGVETLRGRGFSVTTSGWQREPKG